MSTYIDIAISLIAVYVAFSLLVSWVNEQLATAMQWRANNLKDGIAHMFGGDNGVVNQIYAHPLIAATIKDGKDPQYISPRQFSAALISCLETEAKVADAGRILSVDAQWAIKQLPSGALRSGLQSIYDQAGRDYTLFIHGIENWYDDQMDRISGWYRQHTSRVILIVAAIVVPLLNIDTISIVKQVSCESGLRAAIAGQIEKNPNVTEQEIVQNVFANISVGWRTSREVQPCPAGGGATPSASSDKKAVTTPAQAVLHWQVARWYFWSFWLLKVLGLALTTVALAQGAPFWFDLLKSIVNVRNAGNVPAPAQPPPARAA